MSLIAWILISVAIFGLAVILLMTEVKVWALKFVAEAGTVLCSLIRKGQKILKRVKNWFGRLLGEEDIDGGGDGGNPMNLREYREFLEKLADEGKIRREDITKYLTGEMELDLGSIG